MLSSRSLKRVYCQFCRGKNNFCANSECRVVNNRVKLKRVRKNEIWIGNFVLKGAQNNVIRICDDDEIPIVVDETRETMEIDNCIETLPETIILHVFSFLSMSDLLRARLVCEQWRMIAEDNQLWQLLDLSCKNINELFYEEALQLPKHLKDKINTINLMWSYISVSALKHLIEQFSNTSFFLLRYCKLVDNKHRVVVEDLPYQIQTHLNCKVEYLDLRNVMGKWSNLLCQQLSLSELKCLAFSESLQGKWINHLSMTLLPKLCVLQILSNPCITDDLLSTIIKNSPSLQSLSIQSCMLIKGTFLKDLVSLTKLKMLDINSMKLTGIDLTSIDWQSTQIESLNMSFCCSVSEHELKHLLNNLTHVKSISMSFLGRGRSFSDSVINDITSRSNSSFRSLESIDLHSTFNISVQGLIRLLSSTIKLKRLRLGNVLRTEYDLVTTLKCLPHVQNLSLQLSEVVFEADTLFEMLSNFCPWLKTLFVFNINFEQSLHTGTLQDSLNKFFRKCEHARDIFVGGYSHKQKTLLESTINNITRQLELNVNTVYPKQAIPSNPLSFDKYLSSNFKARNYSSMELKMSLRRTVNCQSFYKTGLDKVNGL